MPGDPTSNLIACIQKHCKLTDTAFSLTQKMSNISRDLTAKKFSDVTSADLDGLKKLCKEMKAHKVKIDTVKCVLSSCTKEYAANMEHAMKRAAEQMSSLVRGVETVVKMREKASKNTKSAKATTKKRASKKPI